MIQKNGKFFDVLLDDNILYIVRKICLIQDGIIILRCFQFELTNFWGRSMFLPKRKQANKNKFIMSSLEMIFCIQNKYI